MEELSRLRLYRELIDILKERRWYEPLEVNIKVLSDIEPLFLTPDRALLSYDYPAVMESTNIIESTNYDIIEILQNNIEVSEENNYLYYTKAGQTLLQKLRSVVKENTQEDSSVDKKPRSQSYNIFNKILKALGEFNNSFFPDGIMPIRDRERGRRPQVFLSHAYVDKLYTAALFEYFYNRGVYLYVDWMHQGRQNDGRLLKQLLKSELDRSSQFLFLRTVNSELNIQGQHIIRHWCAWEIGNYYGQQSDEKYIVNLYSVKRFGKNPQLHGLKLYSGINNGRLFGPEITP